MCPKSKEGAPGVCEGGRDWGQAAILSSLFPAAWHSPPSVIILTCVRGHISNLASLPPPLPGLQLLTLLQTPPSLPACTCSLIPRSLPRVFPHLLPNAHPPPAHVPPLARSPSPSAAPSSKPRRRPRSLSKGGGQGPRAWGPAGVHVGTRVCTRVAGILLWLPVSLCVQPGRHCVPVWKHAPRAYTCVSK